jgi:OTU-like cysteine protease
MEITALSRALKVPIEIYSSASDSPLIISPPGEEEEIKHGDVVRLAFYQNMFGLGAHYNVLYKK